MKLSKAQQEVVDKMRDGWIIRYGNFIGLVKEDTKQLWGNIHPATFRALQKHGIVEYYKGEFPFSYYRLTEQYKNEQK